MTRTADQRLGWALVGIGHHADKFVAPAFGKARTAELVAVFSRDAERGRAFAEKHGAARAYDSLAALLEDPRVDAVFLCSPNHVHKEQVLLCAAAGKPALCEKPLSASVEECRDMVDTCKRAGVKLGVGFHLRHNPVHTKLRDLVADGAIGDLTFAEVHYFHVTAGSEAKRELPAWRRDPAIAGGGRFQGTGLHAVDLLRFVTGREIAELTAFADAGWGATGYEKLITAAVRLGGDVLASLSSGPMRYPFNALTVYGSTGTLRATGSVGNYGGGRLEHVTDRGTEAVDFGPTDVYADQLDAFADAIRRDAEPSASGIDGLKNAQISASVYRSLRERATVSLED